MGKQHNQPASDSPIKDSPDLTHPQRNPRNQASTVLKETTTDSKVGFGWVRHRRYLPKPHHFQYPLHLFCLNLDHLESNLNQHPCYSTRPNLVWFRRKDYFNPDQDDLKQALIDHITQLTGQQLSGPILITTHLRCAGFNFNPVTFYFCFDRPKLNNTTTHNNRQSPQLGQQPSIILAQITNTPWGERHTYALSCFENLQQPGVIAGQQRGNIQIYAFNKEFLVSPFLPMDMHYRWAFKFTPTALIVHMTNQQAGQTYFDATLSLNWQPLTRSTLTSALLTHPLMPLKAISGIYWQAFKLLVKRIPFYGHP